MCLGLADERQERIDHVVQHQVVCPECRQADRWGVNELGTPSRLRFGTVDEFVAVKASDINRVQQPSTTHHFCVIESKGLPRRVFQVEHLFPNQIPALIELY
jgi:hypothetical protein